MDLYYRDRMVNVVSTEVLAPSGARTIVDTMTTTQWDVSFLVPLDIDDLG